MLDALPFESAHRIVQVKQYCISFLRIDYLCKHWGLWMVRFHPHGLGFGPLCIINILLGLYYLVSNREVPDPWAVQFRLQIFKKLSLAFVCFLSNVNL